MIKVLFQEGRALSPKGEEKDVVFIHFSRKIDFSKERDLLEKINLFRKERWGDLPPVVDGNLSNFDGHKVVELVVNDEGNEVMVRAEYGKFSCSKWSRKNTAPISSPPKWRRIDSPKNFCRLGDLISDDIIKKVSSEISAKEK